MDNESFRVRSCLFCNEETTAFSSDIEIKEDKENGAVDNFGSNIQSWNVPAEVKGQLKSIFIVRKLLDIPEEKCAEYLQHIDNLIGCESGSRSSWFAVCKSCNSSVEESYKVYREIKRLECELESIKVKLKCSILRVKVNDGNNGRRTRGNINAGGLGKARDFIHVDIRKVVSKENVYILPDQELPVSVVATQQTEKRAIRKRRTRAKASKICTDSDLPDSDWHLDSALDDYHYHDTSDFDTDWQPIISNQESDLNHLAPNVKEEKLDVDEYDSDYTPSLRIRKRNSRCKTKTRTKKKMDDEKVNNVSVGDAAGTGQETEKRNENVSKPVRNTYVHKCKLCIAFFRSNKSFERHERLHSRMTGFPCPHCGWLFHTSRGLQLHLTRKHNKSTRKKRKSRKCQKYNYEELEAIPYYCDHCHMIYKSKAYLLRHIANYHNNIAYLTCNFCESPFPTKQLLELHCKTQHPPSSDRGGDDDVPAQIIKEEPQMCEHCSKSFSSKLKLDLHIATYHLDILFTCKICGFKAGKYHRLLEHNRGKHTSEDKKEQPYMCEHCPKAFSSSSYLIAHTNATHFDLIGNTPVMCKECNVTFPNASALLDHENYVHKKIKGRCCEYCGKAFSRVCDLRKHILLHTAPREEQYKKGPFYCQFCEAKFNVRQALYYHLKRHHTDRYAHKCEYCGTGYVTQNTLLQHLRKCKAKKKTLVPPTQTSSSSAVAATIDVSVKHEGNNA